MFFNKKPKAAAAAPPAAQQIPPKKQMQAQKKGSGWKVFVESIGAKNKGLEESLQKHGIKENLYQFVQRMIIAAGMVSAMIALTSILIFVHVGLEPAVGVILGIVIGIATFQVSLKAFLNFPNAKGVSSVKNIERDILFAARDLIISLRSGMPLYNAITLVSSGYGDASREFAKIVEKVQVGMPLEMAIDQSIEETKSPSFRRILLQASVSIKSGSDVVTSLQTVIDQLAQERVIELRRYGQRLNAIAMFYMLFGIIMPSMGIAVLTILTTFIAVFTVNTTILEASLVGMIFLQIIFLKMITGSRPVFSM
ncbi:MAG: type II secretion system F family protein [Candidatus Marsarchaeota archaeon]|nr:type II secretion system F family protein [Candidatus Marsarchaeota archaeon]